MRAAHRAEMRELRAFLWQRLIVKLPRLVRVEAQVELVLPTELETRFRERVVADLRAGMPFGKVRGMRRDLIRHDAVLDVVLVRQSEVLLGRHVAQHRRTVPTDHRRSDRAGDVIVTGRDVGRERSQRVERSFLAVLELQVHVLADELHGYMSRSLDHHLAVMFPGNISQLAERLEFRDLCLVVRIVDRTGTQAVAERVRHVVRRHDLADVFEMRIEKTLLVVRQAPLRHDRTAARNDSRHAFCRHWDEWEPYACVDGEVVHALLGLLDQRIAKNFPGQLFGFAVYLFQRLVDRHRAYRHRSVADDPFARLVNVLASGEIHNRVAAPAYRPGHFLDLLGDAGTDSRVSDVGVDLHQKVAPDNHRFGFGMIDIRRNDRTAASHFLANEFRGDEFRERVAPLVFPDRDIFHLRRDDAPFRVVHLGHVAARRPPARLSFQVEAHLCELWINKAFNTVPRSRARQFFRIGALLDPLRAHGRQAGANVDFDPRVGVGAGGVIDEKRRIFLRPERGRRLGLNDLAHRHKKVAARAFDVNFARVRHGFDRGIIDARGLGEKLRIGVHGAPLTHGPQGAKGPAVQRFPAAALSASGSKGLLSPGQASLLSQDPYVARRNLTLSGGGWQGYQSRGRIANVSRMQLRSPSRL